MVVETAQCINYTLTDSDCITVVKLLTCKCNGAHAKSGGQCVNVVLAVPLYIRQVLCYGNHCGEDGDKRCDKPAAEEEYSIHINWKEKCCITASEKRNEVPLQILC